MTWNQSSGRVLIVGASGQVGAAMCRFLQASGRAEAVLPASRTPAVGSVPLDLVTLMSPADARPLLESENLSAILCIAGWTHVDGCESDPVRSYQVNAAAPAALAAYAWERRVPYVYYSTDYVFNGFAATPGPYTEEAPTDPLSVYGRDKLDGEGQVLGFHPEALILRTSGVYGADEQGKNFVYQVLKRLTLGEPVRVPEDQSSTPAYNVDLARATFALLEAGATGVYHACGPDVVNRRQFAERIAQEFGFGTDSIEGVSTASLRQPAPRPLIAGLDSSKLAKMCPEAEMRGIHEALADCHPTLEASIARWGDEAAVRATRERRI